MSDKLKDLVADLQGELQAQQAALTALTIQVKTLRAHKQEAEAWLGQNWQRYSKAKLEFEDMKRQCRELAAGLERAGVE